MYGSHGGPLGWRPLTPHRRKTITTIDALHQHYVHPRHFGGCLGVIYREFYWSVRRFQHCLCYEADEDPYYDPVKPTADGGQDVEDVLETPTPRYRPESIDSICKLTRFSRREVQIMYRGFKQCCPTGIVTLAQFKEIYTQFFPQGCTSKYAEFVFRTFDRDGDGMITFEEFMLGLSILSRGTLDDKLAWVFDLYDNKRRGFIDRDELFIVVQSIYDLMGSHTEPPVHRNSVSDHVNTVFQRMDANSDGVITRSEFIETCKQDSAISNSVLLFDTKL